MKYKVERNRCQCHRETCSCPDWAVFDSNGDKFVTHDDNRKLEKIVLALNRPLEQNIKEQLLNLVGYTDTPNSCSKCEYIKLDPSTDNFGPGDQCIRNPDFQFQVKTTGYCNKFSIKSVK